MSTFLAILNEYKDKVIYINAADVKTVTLQSGVVTMTLRDGYFYSVKNEEDVERLLGQLGELANLSPREIAQQPHRAKTEDEGEQERGKG